MAMTFRVLILLQATVDLREWTGTEVSFCVLQEEQDLEEDTGNDWTRSCLLYHSEDPETEREL